MEEIRGFSDACHASHEDLAAFILTIGAFKAVPSCSVFAVSNGSDIIFGRNYDFFYSFKKYVESHLTCPKNGYWSIGHSDIFIGREDGVNEKGLAISMRGVEGKLVKPGVSFCLALRYVLDNCANVKEAVKTLLDMRSSTAYNYLLADEKGDMAVVEASPEKAIARWPEESINFMVCTNHFLHPEMQEMENLEERSKSNWDTIPRYTTIYNMLKEKAGRIDVKGAQKILANHSGYVCSHQEKIKLGTLWSIVATLKKPQIYRAEGHPCRTKYVQDPRLSKALRIRKKTRDF